MARKMSLFLGFMVFFGLLATTSVSAQIPDGLSGRTVWVHPNPGDRFSEIRVTTIWIQYDRHVEEWMLRLWTGNEYVHVRSSDARSRGARNYEINFTYRNQRWFVQYFNGTLIVSNGSGRASGRETFRRG